MSALSERVLQKLHVRAAMERYWVLLLMTPWSYEENESDDAEASSASYKSS